MGEILNETMKAAAPAHARKGDHFASMSDDNWGSPDWIVEGAREFMGAIDLDPASDAFRNATVKADVFLGLDDVDPDWGIPIDWGEAKSVFVNPPGGVTAAPGAVMMARQKMARARKDVSLSSVFWYALSLHVEAKEDAAFVWYCYNINQLQQLQRFAPLLMSKCCVLVPDQRVSNLDRQGVLRRGAPSAAAVLGWKSQIDGRDDDWHHNFLRIFESKGVVWRP